MFGITAEGFKIKSSDEIKSDLEQALATRIPGLNIAAQTPQGQFIGIMTEVARFFWELDLQTFQSFDILQAEGLRLDRLLLLSNRAPRRPETSSIADVQFTGTVGFVIPAGFVVSNNIGDQFATASDVTIPVGGEVDAQVISLETGQIAVDSGTITTVVSVSADISAVNNADAGVIGNDRETDAEIKARTVQATIGTQAQNINEALQSKLNNLSGVQEAVVYDNRTGSIDANGIPSHHFAPVLLGGDATEIGNQIWLDHTSGNGSFGTEDVEVNDSLGSCQVVSFSRAQLVNAFVRIEVCFPNIPGCGCTPESLDQIRQNIVDYWEGSGEFQDQCGQIIGRDLFASDLALPVLASGGVRLKSSFVGIVEPATQDSIAAAFNERIVLSADRIVIDRVEC